MAKNLIDKILKLAYSGYTETKINHIINEIPKITNLDEVVDVDGTTYTALTAASQSPSLKIVAALIKAGASPDIQDGEGRSALIIASAKNYTDEYTKIVELLLEHGANVDLQDKNGWTALIYIYGFAFHQDTAIVRLLLEHGANPNIQDTEGKTALMYAPSRSISKENLILLLKHGANIDLRDNTGHTALMYATRTGNRMAVKLLLENGANPDFQDTGMFGNSALIEATGRGDLETVDLLLHHGANMDLQNRVYGNTALMTASYGIKPLHLKIVQQLLKYGANKDIRNNAGQTARDIAVVFEQLDIVGLIDNYLQLQNTKTAKALNTMFNMQTKKAYRAGQEIPLTLNKDAMSIVGSFLSGVEKQTLNNQLRTLGSKSRGTYIPPQYGPKLRLPRNTPEEEAAAAKAGATSGSSGGRRTKHRANKKKHRHTTKRRATMK